MSRSWALWLLAALITLSSAIYQRLTGPTHPKRGKVTLGGETIRYRLIRSWGGAGDAEVRIPGPLPAMQGQILYRRFKTRDELTTLPMQREGNELVGRLPHQPPAGKLEYRVVLDTGGPTDRERVWLGGEGVVIRFKGQVPEAVLLVHVVAMFGAMLWATRTGLEWFHSPRRYAPLITVTLALFTIGGMLLGPVVQKYAFGAYWTGWPFGTDLTDNKTAVAWLLWLAAWIVQRRGGSVTQWATAAAIVTLAVYLIPHSLFGSELKYE